MFYADFIDTHPERHIRIYATHTFTCSNTTHAHLSEFNVGLC